MTMISKMKFQLLLRTFLLLSLTSSSVVNSSESKTTDSSYADEHAHHSSITVITQHASTDPTKENYFEKNNISSITDTLGKNHEHHATHNMKHDDIAVVHHMDAKDSLNETKTNVKYHMEESEHDIPHIDHSKHVMMLDARGELLAPNHDHKNHVMMMDSKDQDAKMNHKDHDMDMNHKDHDMDMNKDHDMGMDMSMMMMYFHVRVEETVLFKDWKITTVGGLVGSMIGIFLLGMFYEGLKYFREYLFKQYVSSIQFSTVAVTGESGRVTQVHKVEKHHMLSWPHALQTCLHVLQIIMSYFLMLIFMTYNVWLCIAVVLGAGVGYFIFGWKKASVVDITEHCH